MAIEHTTRLGHECVDRPNLPCAACLAAKAEAELTPASAHDQGFDLYCYCKGDIRCDDRVKYEGLGYTCVQFDETLQFDGQVLLYLGIKPTVPKPTRRKRGLLDRGTADLDPC